MTNNYKNAMLFHINGVTLALTNLPLYFSMWNSTAIHTPAATMALYAASSILINKITTSHAEQQHYCNVMKCSYKSTTQYVTIAKVGITCLGYMIAAIENNEDLLPPLPQMIGGMTVGLLLINGLVAESIEYYVPEVIGTMLQMTGMMEHHMEGINAFH